MSAAVLSIPHNLTMTQYENNQIQQRASSKALLDYTQLDEVLRERKGR